MKKFFVAALMSLMMVSLASFCFAEGDTGILSGVVVDAEYGEAVDGALVFVRICTEDEDGNMGTHLYSATSDALGGFVIYDVPAGEWEAVAKLRGTGRDEQVVLIEAGAETIVTFELVPNECPGGLMRQLQHHGGE